MASKSFVFFTVAALVAQFARADNSCQYAYDGMCDDPQYCDPGTDDNDCFQATGCQVDLYQHGGWGGWRASYFEVRDYDFNDFLARGAQNDAVSSLSVAGNCQATLYEHSGFGGRSATFTAGDYDVGQMQAGGMSNDMVSSLKVQPCQVELYQHNNYGGYKAVFGVGTYDINAMVNGGAANDDISSVKVVGNCKAVLYQHSGFGGWSATFNAGSDGSYRSYDLNAMRQAGAQNDAVSSLKVFAVDNNWRMRKSNLLFRQRTNSTNSTGKQDNATVNV